MSTTDDQTGGDRRHLQKGRRERVHSRAKFLFQLNYKYKVFINMAFKIHMQL